MDSCLKVDTTLPQRPSGRDPERAPCELPAHPPKRTSENPPATYVARAWGDFHQTNLLTWVYVGAFGLTLVGISVLHLSLQMRHRRA